jgi:hypothetical protein
MYAGVDWLATGIFRMRHFCVFDQLFRRVQHYECRTPALPRHIVTAPARDACLRASRGSSLRHDEPALRDVRCARGSSPCAAARGSTGGQARAAALVSSPVVAPCGGPLSLRWWSGLRQAGERRACGLTCGQRRVVTLGGQPRNTDTGDQTVDCAASRVRSTPCWRACVALARGRVRCGGYTVRCNPRLSAGLRLVWCGAWCAR